MYTVYIIHGQSLDYYAWERQLNSLNYERLNTRVIKITCDYDKEPRFIETLNKICFCTYSTMDICSTNNVINKVYNIPFLFEFKFESISIEKHGIDELERLLSYCESILCVDRSTGNIITKENLPSMYIHGLSYDKVKDSIYKDGLSMNAAISKNTNYQVIGYNGDVVMNKILNNMIIRSNKRVSLNTVRSARDLYRITNSGVLTVALIDALVVKCLPIEEALKNNRGFSVLSADDFETSLDDLMNILIGKGDIIIERAIDNNDVKTFDFVTVRLMLGTVCSKEELMVWIAKSKNDLFKIVYAVVSANDAYRKFGVPVIYLKTDNITLSKQRSIDFKLSIKGEINSET